MSAVRRMAVVVLAVVVALGAAASPASAHAILLRTDPSPQTTVKAAPAVVRLYFSEPVEVAFGAVRVFDVDGKRVDRGSIRRAAANRQVLASTPGLVDGSYTVTWRVASADGHPVSGGYSFYVGAPSSISAVAVPIDQGAGRAIGWGFGAVRFAWFSAFLVLVGLVSVRRRVWTPAIRDAGLTDAPPAQAFRRRFARAFPAVWVVLAVATVLWLVFQTASISGLPLLDSCRPNVLSDVLRTSFGRLWLATAVVTALAVLPVVALSRGRPLLGIQVSRWIVVLCVLATALALLMALNGHARVAGHPALAVPTVAVHLLSVGVWVGSLVVLVVLCGSTWTLVPGEDRPKLLGHLVRRFSSMAVAAVVVVVLTGTVGAFAELASVSDLWRIPYGRAVSAKVVLLILALVLAARHRQRVPRRLAEPSTATATARSFRRSSALEAVLLVVTVAVAAGLVALVPGRSLALAARGPVNQQHSARDYTIQLFIDPTKVGDNQIHLTFVNPQGLGAAEVSTMHATLAPLGGASEPLKLRLISPGHFVADAKLPGPGRYRIAASSDAVSPSLSTTFDFRLRGETKTPPTTEEK